VITILLTDDEPGVRAPLRRILEDFGYHVLEAVDGEDAIELAEQADGPIDLLLTDLVMPRMGGEELARRLGGLHPRMKILFMSGYSVQAVTSGGALLPGAGFIAKPFSAIDLVDRVRETLAAPPAHQRP
jgi:CheY-like chemotaxis protein